MDIKNDFENYYYRAKFQIKNGNYDKQFKIYLSYFRLDHTLQDIVYKLVPGLFQSK